MLNTADIDDSFDTNSWVWVEERLLASLRAAAIASIKLELLMEHCQKTRRVLSHSNQLYLSANMSKRSAFRTGNVANIKLADEAMKKSVRRYRQAEESLSSLREKIQTTTNEKTKLEAELAAWEQIYWRCLANWFADVWGNELRSVVPSRELMNCYWYFNTSVCKKLYLELDAFYKVVRVFMKSQL